MAYNSNEHTEVTDDCEHSDRYRQCRINERETGGREKEKNIQWICQLAFPSEKVIRLTAPKMSWEYKGFRRQEAWQHDLQVLTAILCVYL